MKEEFCLSEKRKEVDRMLVKSGLNLLTIKLIHNKIQEQDREFIKEVIEKDLEMCKVCGGSHGSWLDKDDFVKKFKKRAGEELVK